MQFESTFPSAPVPRTVCNSRSQLSSFRVDSKYIRRAFGATERHEGSIWMEDGQVAFQVVQEVEFHLGEFVDVGGKALCSVLLF